MLFCGIQIIIRNLSQHSFLLSLDLSGWIGFMLH